MYVRVGDVKKWVGREARTILEAPWPEALADVADGSLAEEPRGTVRVQNTGAGLLVSVAGEAALRMVCSRCAEECVVRVPFAAEQEYREQEPGVEDDWMAYQGDVIVLDDLVADAVALAMPMAPLCDGACRGLCPGCGTNLNQGACACADAVDERWAGLRAWSARPGDRGR